MAPTHTHTRTHTHAQAHNRQKTDLWANLKFSSFCGVDLKKSSFLLLLLQFLLFSLFFFSFLFFTPRGWETDRGWRVNTLSRSKKLMFFGKIRWTSKCGVFSPPSNRDQQNKSISAASKMFCWFLFQLPTKVPVQEKVLQSMFILFESGWTKGY